MPSYDYPFNERIRTLLRLEDLFTKILYFVEGDQGLHHQAALLTLFQVLDVIDRAELKTDLLQELDRQKIVMENLRGNPSISEAILDQLIGEIGATVRQLRGYTGKVGQNLRDNEWLMSLKQRAGIPGGMCEFDVPSYHYWLDLPAAQRRADLQHWLSSLMPLYDSLRIILHILRGSGSPSLQIARQGLYQQMLGGGKPAQMVRVKVDDAAQCFPEVSANRYAINIRFHQLDGAEKPRAVETEVSFELTLCNL